MKVRFPSPTTVIASLALLLSLTGTAVAAGLITGAQIQNNTVSSLDLTNNNVKSVDLKDNEIRSIDVMNGQLKAVDFAPGQIPPGPAGPAGQAGPAGPQGAPGLAGVEIVSVQSPNNSDNWRKALATCPAGKRLVGGGARIFSGLAVVFLDESYPSDAMTWHAEAYESSPIGGNWYLEAYAICAVAS